MHGRSWMILGLSVLTATVMVAATPDEDYVRIYKSIVDADALRDGGQTESASRAYTSARDALRQLQVSYPAWNERLLIYRLNYINNQLKVGSGSSTLVSRTNAPGTTPQSPVQGTAPTQPQSPFPIGTPAPEQQLQQLRDENQTLRLASTRLEAKLREALSVQPPSTDPVELARVQEQLKDLSKAHEQLKSVLNAQKPNLSQSLTNLLTNAITRMGVNTVTNTITITNTLTSVVTNVVRVDPPDVAQLRVNLTNQLGAVAALRSENDVLKKELTQARQAPPPTPAPANPQLEKQLQEALRDLKSVQESNQDLVKKQANLEQRLVESTRTQGEQSEKLKQFDNLEKSLTQTREESRRLSEAKLAMEKKLAESVSAKVPDSESGRRIMKLERDLLESQSEGRLLARQKATLEQRLTEGRAAIASAGNAAAPTAIIPGAGGEAASTEIHRQLKQAAWEVLNLQAANAELTRRQTGMEQQLAKSSSSSATFENIDQDRLRRLERMNQDLVESRQATTRLEQENQTLSRQLEEARRSGSALAQDEPARRQVLDAQDKVKQAEQANRELLKRATDLERQIAEAKSGVSLAGSPAGGDAQRADRLLQELNQARANAQRLESENTDLEKRLASADTTKGDRRQPSRATTRSNMERELLSLRSRLAAYEAATVPYTEQELALFGRLEVNIAASSAEPSPSSSPSVGSASSTPPAAAINLLNDARKDFEAGNYRVAEQKFQEALKADNKNLFTLAHLAAAQFEQSKLGEAEKTIQRALSASPDDAPSLYLMGIIRLRQDKTDEALDLLSRSAKANPQNAVTQNSLGVAMSQKGLREPAETAFRKALQIRPDYPEAHYNLAVEYILQNPPAFKLAQWHYQKAVGNGHPKNDELEKRLATATAAGTPPPPANSKP